MCESVALTSDQHSLIMRCMRLSAKLRLRRGAARLRRADRAAIRVRRYQQFERSHSFRKDHVTEANKQGMGFNGL
jgi:hypothetical protein